MYGVKQFFSPQTLFDTQHFTLSAQPQGTLALGLSSSLQENQAGLYPLCL